MVDSISRERRSEVMSRVRGKDTQPELRLRRLVHGMGYRYRFHVAGLPGRPDRVLARHGAVIFMHGCFCHRHDGCALARMTKYGSTSVARALTPAFRGGVVSKGSPL